MLHNTGQGTVAQKLGCYYTLKKETGSRDRLITQTLETMTDAQKLRDIEIRNIANKYLSGREHDLRTEKPLPADYSIE